jgi:hypothetical protein
MGNRQGADPESKPGYVPVMFTIRQTAYLNAGLTNAEIAAHTRRFKPVQPFAQKYAQFIIKVLPWTLVVTIVLNALAQANDRKSSSDPRTRIKHQAEYWIKQNSGVVAIERDADLKLVNDISHYRKNIDQAAAELGVSNQVPELYTAVTVMREYLITRERTMDTNGTPTALTTARNSVVHAIEKLEEKRLDLWGQMLRRRGAV